MVLQRQDKHGRRVRMKRKEDEMALREVADLRRRRQREQRGPEQGPAHDRLGQDRLERDRVVQDRIAQDRLEQAPYQDPQLLAWANDAIWRSHS